MVVRGWKEKRCTKDLEPPTPDWHPFPLPFRPTGKPSPATNHQRPPTNLTLSPGPVELKGTVGSPHLPVRDLR